MRGKQFHNYLVNKVCKRLESSGCKIKTEYPIQLPSGKMNFVDILASQSGVDLIVECETTIRNLYENVIMAKETNLPIWVIVPDRDLKNAAIRKLKRHNAFTNGFPVILLESAISGQKHNIFPLKHLITDGE